MHLQLLNLQNNVNNITMKRWRNTLCSALQVRSKFKLASSLDCGPIINSRLIKAVHLRWKEDRLNVYMNNRGLINLQYRKDSENKDVTSENGSF